MSKSPSWGRLNSAKRSTRPFEPSMAAPTDGSLLAYGNGRSYGDSCHNDAGTLLTTAHNNALISFDRDQGLLTAQSGILLGDILAHLLGSGWFLPVVPGTKFVTLGGAIANDIHGKNHEKRGTFGCHVESFDLWRSDGQVLTCSAAQNEALFAATIGGMGLTGIIVSAQIRLMKVASHFVRESKQPFGSLDEFFETEGEFTANSEYSVAWVDSLARGKSLGRGILMRGDHTCFDDSGADYGPPRLSVPVTPPVPLVSGLPLRLFNMAYFHRNKSQVSGSATNPNSFFFPLDAVAGWNRLYGPGGLFQHQCVIPLDAARQTIPQLLDASHHAGQGSFLTVLKRFGARQSPGFMSFPQSGYTLTLDFANRGHATRELLDHLDAITLDAGGRTNPYKDARMSPQTFQKGFPLWQQLENLRDPAIQSDFWRRVSAAATADRLAIAAPPPLSPPPLETPVNQTAQRGVQKTPVQTQRDKNRAGSAKTGTQ
ncbi:MAG: FAD-binding oxidoreductase [Rhizobiaceae bacterium]